jgi:arylsulfate sulfotransferase
VTVRRAVLALLALALPVACSGADHEQVDESRVAEPSGPITASGDGVEVTVGPGPHSVLTAVIAVEADHRVRPRVVAVAGEHRVEVPPRRRPARHWEIPLVGLRPETTYNIDLRGDPALAALDGRLSFRTGSLPGDLPAVVARANGRARPGFTLANAYPNILAIDHPGVLLAVDETGTVVWYHLDSQTISDARQLPNGDLLYNFGNLGAREIDVLGNVVHDWTTDTRVAVGQRDRFGHETFVDDAIVIDTPRLHHEVADLLPNGNFLALSQEVREYRGFGPVDCPPEPFRDGVRPERGDIVIEYTPAGRIVHQVALLDSIDPREEPGSQQCNLKTDAIATGRQVFVDWSHANSAELFEDQNVVLVSARNLSSVIALRWRADADGPAGEVLWQFGPGHDFRLTEGEWFYRQHAPEVEPDGTILLYDNGSQRPVRRHDKPLPYSRAVQYRLDLSGPRGTWTARQIWEHRIDTPAGPVFSDFLGDADDIGGGHVLITHGALEDRETELLSAWIVEVERRSGEVVLSLRIHGGDGVGWNTYRAAHLDTWYPRDADGLPPAGDPVLPLPGYGP